MAHNFATNWGFKVSLFPLLKNPMFTTSPSGPSWLQKSFSNRGLEYLRGFGCFGVLKIPFFKQKICLFWKGKVFLQRKNTWWIRFWGIINMKPSCKEFIDWTSPWTQDLNLVKKQKKTTQQKQVQCIFLRVNQVISCISPQRIRVCFYMITKVHQTYEPWPSADLMGEFLLLMVQKSHSQPPKGCINYQPLLVIAGFLPSTVLNEDEYLFL